MALVWKIPDPPAESNNITLPAGVILFFDGEKSSIPSGWSEFTDSASRFPYGVGTNDYTYTGGGSVPNKTQGQAIHDSFSSTSSSEGSHNHTTGEWTSLTSPGSLPQYRTSNVFTNDAGGAHTHVTSLQAYTPDQVKLILIKADSNTEIVPDTACFLATSNSSMSGSSLAHDGRYISAVAGGDSGSSTVAATTFGASCASSGMHGHGSQTSLYNVEVIVGGPAPINKPVSTIPDATSVQQIHLHTISTPNVNSSIRRAAMRLYKRGSDGNILKASSDIIGLWESATPPTGWSICDGTNGTPDLRDCFIEADDAGDGTVTGDNSLTISGTTNTNAWSHSHFRTFGYGQDWNPTAYSHDQDWNLVGYSHSHTFNESGDWFIDGFTMYFIKYTG